ncbi:mar1 putative transposase, putative [Trichomonas vaginalis G3]|uniref:Mar1 putative transposase, putative n=1 Tax=Trichomonas vaginalis (strain ATCC PRA-98 / G3) TaxID=412133 RepID=A2EZI7_TRIV3|nr:mar1 putative transposase, putative [Trichomonas vaginalis G3]|eukprot:XP_001314434.1 mar1 transposase [Trichomonas vaginalis G3]
MDAPSYSTVTYHVRMYHFMNKKAPIIKIDKKSPDQRKIKAILVSIHIKGTKALRTYLPIICEFDTLQNR